MVVNHVLWACRHCALFLLLTTGNTLLLSLLLAPTSLQSMSVSSFTPHCTGSGPPLLVPMLHFLSRSLHPHGSYLHSLTCVKRYIFFMCTLRPHAQVGGFPSPTTARSPLSHLPSYLRTIWAAWRTISRPQTNQFTFSVRATWTTWTSWEHHCLHPRLSYFGWDLSNPNNNSQASKDSILHAVVCLCAFPVFSSGGGQHQVSTHSSLSYLCTVQWSPRQYQFLTTPTSSWSQCCGSKSC